MTKDCRESQETVAERTQPKANEGLRRVLGGATGSIFIYCRRDPDAALLYRVPGYLWTPMAFIVAAMALVGDKILRQPGRVAVGLGLVGLGAPAYLIWRQGAKEKTQKRYRP
jgi:hypothetical protein